MASQISHYMIFESLSIVVENLSSFLFGQGLIDDKDKVKLQNISLADLSTPNPAVNLNQSIILSLVNVAEEFSMKNQPALRVENGKFANRFPTVNLNLYLLIAANDSANYDNALRWLSGVITFFQGKKVFNLRETPISNSAVLGREGLEDVELVFELHTLTFEQINHLWGALGGKQLPFVLYKVRLVSLSLDRDLSRGELIRQVNSQNASNL